MEFHALPVIVIIIQQTVKGGGVALFSLSSVCLLLTLSLPWQLMVFWSSMCSAFKSSQSVITCTSLIRSSWSYFRHLFHHSMANSTGMEGCCRKICWWLQLRCASLTRSCFAGLDHQISCFVWGSFTFPRLNMKSPPVPHHQRGRHRRAFPVIDHQSGPDGGCAVLDVGEGEGMFWM